MRPFAILLCLVATLLGALSASIVPPDGLCREGIQRCHLNALEECNYRGEFKIVQQCSDYEICTIYKRHGGECLPQGTLQPTARPDPAYCPIFGEQRCKTEGQIEECNSRNVWSPTNDCGPLEKCSETAGYAQCVPLPSTLKVVPKRTESHTEPTTLSSRGALDPVCETGARACDKEGWHAFECDSNGQWALHEQCAFKGNCRFNPMINKKGCIYELPPSFNEECEEHTFVMCEIGGYAFCKTYSTPAKCQRHMCEYNCVACQRCQYKPNYGVPPEPDLTTDEDSPIEKEPPVDEGHEDK
ncbi:hypothetical protein IQ07DRAFT_606171 [Pyrenochaeta sp. DS3sAY3a]|nr:hypothetical protein IQ07DRAFT_606171 [Pyrenochaeta sp. DS3sAY3a]